MCLVTHIFLFWGGGGSSVSRHAGGNPGSGRSVQLSDLVVVKSNKLPAPGDCQLRMLMA